MEKLSRTPESLAAAKLVLDIGAAIKTITPDLIPGDNSYERVSEVLFAQLADYANVLVKEAAPDLSKERRHQLLQLIVDHDGDAVSLIELGFALARALETEAA